MRLFSSLACFAFVAMASTMAWAAVPDSTEVLLLDSLDLLQPAEQLQPVDQGEFAVLWIETGPDEFLRADICRLASLPPEPDEALPATCPLLREPLDLALVDLDALRLLPGGPPE